MREDVNFIQRKVISEQTIRHIEETDICVALLILSLLSRWGFAVNFSWIIFSTVSIEQKIGWPRKEVLENRKLSSIARNRTPDRPAYNLVAVPITLSRLDNKYFREI